MNIVEWFAPTAQRYYKRQAKSSPKKPQPKNMTQLKTIEQIEELFGLLESWEDRYAFLIDLGKTTLPALESQYYRDEFLVKGCTSKVWLVPRIEGGRFYFDADSDAFIVKGLVALLHIIYNGLKVEDIAAIDSHSIFARLGLDQNLSPNRRNGFFAMVERMKDFAIHSTPPIS